MSWNVVLICGDTSSLRIRSLPLSVSPQSAAPYIAMRRIMLPSERRYEKKIYDDNIELRLNHLEKCYWLTKQTTKWMVRRALRKKTSGDNEIGTVSLVDRRERVNASDNEKKKTTSE